MVQMIESSLYTVSAHMEHSNSNPMSELTFVSIRTGEQLRNSATVRHIL